MLTVLRYAISLMAILVSASCATTASLKINEIRECLAVGADINFVASCIKPSFGYQMKSSEGGKYGMDIYRLKMFCPDASYRNCSHWDLHERVNIGLGYIIIQPEGKKQGELEVVRDPYLLFYSEAGNLGGPFVMLYVFYKESDGRVIGWANLGSALHQFDFRAAQK
jgi:hypothetical protein